jgi:hypothetical protein
VVQESDGSGITITNVKKARRKKVKIFPVGLMSGVTAGDPFPEDFEVGILELRFSNSQDPSILDPFLLSNDQERQLLYAFGQPTI